MSSHLASHWRDTLAAYADDEPSALALPSDAYASPDLFEAEADAVFRRSWMLVAPLDQLREPGSYVAVDIAGEPIVVVRTDDGLRAMSRLCPHRGMPLVEAGSGTTPRFTCGYHSWAFRLDGSLIGAPLMDAPTFDRNACALPSVRLEEWHGFVFVNLDPEAPPLATRLAGIADAIGHYDLGNAVTLASCDEVWDINWKLGVENSSESYHHMSVHATTVGPAAPPKHTWLDAATDHWALHRTRLTEAAAMPDLEGTLPLTDDDHAALRCYTIFPSTVILTSGFVVNWLSYLPVSPQRTRLRAGLAFPAAMLEGQDRAELSAAIQPGFDAVNGEDAAVVTALQAAAGARLLTRGPLSSREGVLPHLYRAVARALLPR